MESELVSLKFDKILQSKSYSCIVMGTDKTKFAIYTDVNSGKAMQMYLTGAKKGRPSTHDLISHIFRGLDIKVKQVVISDVQDTVYFARLFLEQKNGEILHIVEIDARPSDCIALALIHKAPLYCTLEALEKIVPVVDD